MPTNEVKVYVSDKIFTAWEDVQIQRNVDSISGSFELGFFDRWGKVSKDWPLIPGKEVKVELNGERVITGYIDELSIENSSDSTSMSISGRDKTCDLVDCSAVPKEYSNLTADKIAKALLAPFSIELSIDADPGEKISKWSVKPGETVFENLERLGKMRALFFVSDGYGVCRMQQRGSAKSNGSIVYGENIINSSVKHDYLNRFSEYKVIGQSSGSDEHSGDETVSSKATSTDSGVSRYRPIIIQGESNIDNKTAQLRANWELAVRIANSVKVAVTVYGWTTPNGQLWKVNELVDVKVPTLGIDGEMLISSVNFNLSDDGSTTQFDLVHKDAFLPQPEVVKESTAADFSEDE